MSLRIEKQSHFCQRNMASGPKEWSEARLTAAPGSLFFGDVCAWGIWGSGNVAPTCHKLSSGRRTNVFYGKLASQGDGWWVSSHLLLSRIFFLQHHATSLIDSFHCFPTNNGISECQHCWHLGPDNFFVVVCPVHCRLFSDTLDLYLLDGGDTHLSCSTPWQSKMSPVIAECPLGDKIASCWEPLT